MNREAFKSVFSNQINTYLDLQVQSGYKEDSFYWNLRLFDKFCQHEGIDEPVFTREHNEKWIQRKEDEATTTHYARINKAKNFLIYLARQGFSVYVSRDVRFKPTDFQPHIYTDDEINRYFKVVDEFKSPINLENEIQLPVLFRTLYCCGTRISETLAIKKGDIDLRNGIITLHETKNREHRYIVLNDEMIALYRRFADKCFYQLKEKDYIFRSSRHTKLNYETISKIHIEILRRAGIPFHGEGAGPRIHDWRHTMAVRSFKKLIDSGMDMYCALPILSTYLGHKTIYATEKYVCLVCAYYPSIEEKYSKQLDKIFEGGVMDENN